jgi:tetratricopeptide (TPR) repeat protein
MTEIEKLVERKSWAKARALIQEELIAAPTDHWLWMNLSLTYYEQKKYEKALQCAKLAVEFQPSCPLALWHYAGSLYMSSREDAALAIWTILLGMDLEEVAYGECAEGMDWALQLINDVHYRMGRYYQWKENPEQARVSFKKYLHNRAHGVGSIYDKQKVEKYLAELTPAESPVANGASGRRTVKS